MTYQEGEQGEEEAPDSTACTKEATTTSLSMLT